MNLDAFCGIEIVGDAVAMKAGENLKYQEYPPKYQEYPLLEESTMEEDDCDSIEENYLLQPQNYDDDVVYGTSTSTSTSSAQSATQSCDEEDEEQQNAFSRLAVCYQRADIENEKEETNEYYDKPNRCGCSSSVNYLYYPDSPLSRTKQLTSAHTRVILERSCPKLLLYPEDAPNLLEDSVFEILAPQDFNDEGQAEEVQVLNPDIMEELQSHLPITKKGESFWLQYSLIRDGASMESLLYKIRNTQHCVLAIETVDGEVFGAYTSQKWTTHADFFGTRDAFLWRRNADAKEDEEDIECYHYSYLNDDIQLCTNDRLVVGGGIRKLDPQYGFGISLDRDLLTGTTSKSMTFLNPPLSKRHADGSTFEVRNVEVWALTPCLSLEDAQRVAERVQNKPIWA